MRAYRYVTLDPTGNITCLVLDPAGAEEKARLTRRLLQECEQVAMHQREDGCRQPDGHMMLPPETGHKGLLECPSEEELLADCRH